MIKDTSLVCGLRKAVDVITPTIGTLVEKQIWFEEKNIQFEI